MTSFSLYTYSSSGSSGESVSLTKWVGFREQEISPVGGSLSKSESARSSHESVDVEGGVEVVSSSLAVDDNNKGIDKVAPSEDDWIDYEVRKMNSKFRMSSSLKSFVDIIDIIDPSVADNVFSLCGCSSSNLMFHGGGSSNVDFFPFCTLM